jgi:hypothetical protein
MTQLARTIRDPWVSTLSGAGLPNDLQVEVFHDRPETIASGWFLIA